MTFRLNQRVCKVVWRGGFPGLEFGQVTRVTARTMDVNGTRDDRGRWHSMWAEAVANEFGELFRDQAFGIAEKRGHDMWWTIQRLNRLKRLTRKLQTRGIPQS